MKTRIVKILANLICIFLIFFACTFKFSDSIPRSVEGVVEIGKYAVEEIKYNANNIKGVSISDRESERSTFKDRMSAYFKVPDGYDPIVHSFFIGGAVIAMVVTNIWINKNSVLDENDIYIDEYEDDDYNDDNYY